MAKKYEILEVPHGTRKVYVIRVSNFFGLLTCGYIDAKKPETDYYPSASSIGARFESLDKAIEVYDRLSALPKAKKVNVEEYKAEKLIDPGGD